LLFWTFGLGLAGSAGLRIRATGIVGKPEFSGRLELTTERSALGDISA
jgi:hypothetical protein